MKEALVSLLLWSGGVVMFLAALGIVRLPDLYTRMHAATKVGTLGISGLLLGAMVLFASTGVTTESILIIIFFFLTAPVAAHMISRAAYYTGVRLADQSVVDELKPHADRVRDPGHPGGKES